MAGISTDWEEFWDKIEGPTSNVGLGTIPYQLYHSKYYQKKKQKSVLLGSVSRIVYAGFEHDPQPTILSFKYEPQYNTIMAFNLHYVSGKHRKALLNFVLQTNKLRIKQKKSLMVDYKMIIKAFPWAAMIVRRYKTVGIGVIENVPLIGWLDVINEKTRRMS